MKCGYYVSTPMSRLIEDCQIWASLALYDAMAKGPVAFTSLERRPQPQCNGSATRTKRAKRK